MLHWFMLISGGIFFWGHDPDRGAPAAGRARRRRAHTDCPSPVFDRQTVHGRSVGHGPGGGCRECGGLRAGHLDADDRCRPFYGRLRAVAGRVCGHGRRKPVRASGRKVPAEDRRSLCLGQTSMYTGFYLMSAGAFFYALSVFAGVILLLSVGIHHRIALAEERFMAGQFGSEWKAYAGAVPRYGGFRLKEFQGGEASEIEARGD